MNRFALLGSWALGLGSAPLAAQGIGTSPSWEIAGSVGAGFRSERGRTIGGARLEGALRKPVAGGDRWLEFALGYSQIVAHLGAEGEGANVKENSVELTALGEMWLKRSDRFRIGAAIGPVAAISIGCTSGGSFQADTATALGGETQCTNAFAKKGNIRPGVAARLASEVRGTRAAFIFGVAAAVNTIAAGDGVGYSAFIGLRAALR